MNQQEFMDTLRTLGVLAAILGLIKLAAVLGV